MNLMKRIFGRTETPAQIETPAEPNNGKHYTHGKRSFLAAVRDRFTADWNEIHSLNTSIKEGLSTLRGRAREMSVNNVYVRRYLKLIKANIVGDQGVLVAVQGFNPDGSYDPISKKIEDHFFKWGLPEHCDVSGRMSWVKIQEVVIESVARDGESLVVLRKGLEFGKYALQLQVLDADHLDENFNSTATNGNRIVQSVELDGYGRAVAYWVFERNPSETQVGPMANNRVRIPASDLIHVFDPERASQVRGFTWLAPAMTPLQHLEKFRESTLIAARVAANKQTYYSQGEPAAYDDDEVDDEGNLTFKSTPGQHEILPRGWDVKTVDWAAPTEKLGDFQKHILRGVAAGLGISYNALASDLESVNYSSARFGGLEDQALYRSTQKVFINTFIRRVYEAWLEMQLLTNTWGLNLPESRFEKFAYPLYRPRSWQSVDRVKDANADVIELNNMLASRTDILAKRGHDFEEVITQLAKERIRMTELGITDADIGIAPTEEDDSEDDSKPNDKQNGINKGKEE